MMAQLSRMALLIAPEEGPLCIDGAAAPVDSGSSQAASSSGEGEQPCETPFGLAGETTSEDEWKVCCCNRHHQANAMTCLLGHCHF